MRQPYGDGWNQCWSIVMGICAALVVIATLLAAGDAYGQDEPIPTPDPLPLATGSTRYEVSGLEDAEYIDGVVLAGKESQPKLTAFGFLSVNYSIVSGETCTAKVRAETDDRTRLEVKEFADGFRVDHFGKVWADVEVRYSRTITVDGEPLEVITRIDTQEVVWVIEDTSGPDPPDVEPTPDDGESPFAEDGLRVLIVYERDDLPRNPDLASIVFSLSLAEYLKSVCVAYRVLDQDVEAVAGSVSEWTKALERPRASVPWILIGDGQRGYEGPLPDSVEAVKKLVSKYAD